MKILISLIIILGVTLLSCKKDDDPVTPIKENLLIEEYTYDSTGVIFKIVNDIEHAWNYQEMFVQKIDSICLMKFEYTGTLDAVYTKNFTWFTKKGQYVCWRYKYIHAGSKRLAIGFPNPYRRYIPYKFCLFITDVGCNEISTHYPPFQFLFPMVNDTVIMRLSCIQPSAFLTYK